MNALLLLLLLFAEAPASQHLQITRLPELGIRAAARVGDPLFVEQVEGRVELTLDHAVYLLDRDIRVTTAGHVLPAGTRLRPRSFGKGFRVTFHDACADDLTAGEEESPSRYLCLADIDKNGTFDRVDSKGYPASRISPTPYQRETEKVGTGTYAGYSTRRELLYDGAGGGAIRLTYREFVNDLARPAFTQQATYDYSGGSITFMFKEAQIDVESVAGSEIRYTVRKGFQPN